MRKEIRETIINIYNDQRELVSTKTSETLVIYPDTGKVLVNKRDGKFIEGFVSLGKTGQLENYKEIDKESD